MSLLILARATCSGRETSLLQLCPISRDWLSLTSSPTLERSSTTFTRPPTSCSLICPRVTTRREPRQVRLQDPDENSASCRQD